MNKKKADLARPVNDATPIRVLRAQDLKPVVGGLDTVAGKPWKR